MKKALRILWKITKWTLIVLAVLVAFILCGGLGPLVKWTAPAVAKSMGAELTLDQCVILPLGGYVKIAGLRVENPESFRTKNANVYEKNALAQIGNLEVDVAMLSLFTKEYVVDKVELTGLRALYAFDYDTTNVDALMAEMGLTPAEAAEVQEEVVEETGEAVEEAKTEEAPAEKEELNFRLMYVHLEDNSVTLRKFVSVPLALPPLTLTDVSSQEFAEQIEKITKPIIKTFRTIGDGVGAAVDGIGTGLNKSGELIGDGFNATTETLGDGVKAIGKGAEETFKSIKGLFD